MRVTRTNDAAHKKLSVLVYGDPKVGKTSLAKTLPLSSDDKLFYVAADPGQLALRDREFVVAQPDEGEDLDERFFDQVLAHIKTHGNAYEWIFVDGIDEVAEAVLRSKLRTQRDGRKAYGEMAEYVERWLKAIRDTGGVSVVFATHVNQRDDGAGGVRYIPSFPGKELNKHVNEWFDMIGFMRMVPVNEGSWTRQIQFRPEADPRYEVGDRSGVAEMYEEPDLGKLFSKIHDAGFDFTGTWKDQSGRKCTKQELEDLLKLAEVSEIVATAARLFGGKSPRDLTYGELQVLQGELG